MNVDLTYFILGIAVIPALFGLYLAFKTLYALVTHLWWKLHVRLVAKVKLDTNPVRFNFKKEVLPPRAKYEVAANKWRDILLAMPRFYAFFGLGWYVIIGRDHKDAKPEMSER
jgi:hypothetical protein